MNNASVAIDVFGASDLQYGISYRDNSRLDPETSDSTKKDYT